MESVLQGSKILLLDENMDSLTAVIKAHEKQIGDVLILKIGRFGGITKLKQVFTLRISLNISDYF